MELVLGKGDGEMILKMQRMSNPSAFSRPLEESDEQTETLSKTAPHFRVILFNDENHTYDYVVEMLTQACKLSREAAFRCAVEVDMTGRSAVYYGSDSDCQTVCSQILSFGPDHRLPQSMSSMDAEVQGV